MATKKNILPLIIFIAMVNLYVGLRLITRKHFQGVFGSYPTADFRVGIDGNFETFRNLSAWAIEKRNATSHLNGSAKIPVEGKHNQNLDAKATFNLSLAQSISDTKIEDWKGSPVKREYLDVLAVDVLNHPPPKFVQGLKSPCFVVEDGTSHTHIVKPVETNKKPQQKGRVPPKKTARQKYLIGDQPNYEGLPAMHSNHLRCLPPSYFVGFTKCGTTEFYGHFIQHQHVIAPVFKEPRFWDENRPTSQQKRSLDYMTRNHETMAAIIESCFLGNSSHICQGVFQSQRWDIDIRLNLGDLYRDLQERKNHGRPCPLVSVDSSTTYVSNSFMWERDPANKGLDHPNILAPHRIHHLEPTAKFVILLRNPIERLYSDYNFFTRGKGASFFHKLVVGGIKWWNACVQAYSDEKCAYAYKLPNITDLPNGIFAWGETPALGYNAAGRLRQGLYSIYITKWYEIFPKEQILIIKFEDFSTDTIGLLKSKVYPFLGMDPINETGEQRINELKKKGHLNKRKKGSQKMSAETEQLLKKFYQPYNEKLVKLLGNDKFLW